jgi:glycine/D-amino acid oxidase-like deaminating enzyme
MVPNLNTFSPVATVKPVYRSMPSLAKGSTVAVVGAGAFGGWTALNLLRKGFRVTLIDAWGPGNSRSSSGDETRVIRSTYGANETYFDLNVRALACWKEHEQAFGKQLFFNTGVLWLCYDEKTPLVDDSIPFARKHNMDYHYLSAGEIKKRFPIVRTDDLHHGYFDPYGGYLKARESCQAVKEAFQKESGTFSQAYVTPGKIQSGKLAQLKLSDGTTVAADLYVFACGSWLGALFPETLGNIITCTKQAVYYFGVPATEAAAYDHFPVWVDVDGRDFYYGIPGNAHRGFKIGVDIRGAQFDPSTDDRTVDAAVLAGARSFLEHRFPGLTNAPLVESRVCPYENSPDGNFLVDLLPETDNVLIVGGGSGHGFKHSPALGELVAGALAGGESIPDLFRMPAKP